jgi:hypothetical protein
MAERPRTYTGHLHGRMVLTAGGAAAGQGLGEVRGRGAALPLHEPLGPSRLDVHKY